MTIKKSITINLAQTLITIDEDAYEALQKYLHEVERFFTQTEDSSEIISDIEARIAEVLKEKTTYSHPSISIDDVNDVIAAMGTPDDFAGADSAQTNTSSSEQTSSAGNGPKEQRRLFRDEDNGVIAGVCAGIAAYTGIDVVFIRIAFLLLLFVNGFGILLYIICWIAIPTALTVAEKMQMRGEPVTLESMKARAEEFASSENAKRAQVKIETGARQFASSVQDAGQRFGKRVEGASKTIAPLILRVFGFACLLIVLALLLIVIYISIAISFGLLHGLLPLTLLAALTLPQQWLLGGAVFLLVVLPLCSWLLGSLQMIIQKRRSFPIWGSVVFFGVWIVALCSVITLLVNYPEPTEQQWNEWQQRVEQWTAIESEDELVTDTEMITYTNETVGYRITMPTTLEYDDQGANARFMDSRFHSAVLIRYHSSDENPDLWFGDEPSVEQDDVVIDAIPATKYIYSHCDGPSCEDTVAYVIPYKGKFLAVEFRAGDSSLTLWKQQVLKSIDLEPYTTEPSSPAEPAAPIEPIK